MGAYETRFVKSGDGVAVELPAEFGFEEGMAVTIEKIGRDVKISPVEAEAESLGRLRRMIEELDALGPVPAEHRQTREDVRIEFPDRPGLY